MDDGRVAIRADCNSGSATYTVNGASLTIQPGVMTLVACPPGSQDTVFLRDLMQVASYVFNGPQLVLNMRVDSGNMIFSPQSLTGLAGPTWRVTGYNNGMGGVVSILSGTQLSMVFGDDGRVSGNTGCNMFDGTYTLSGSSLSFGPLVTTRRACASEEANQQEQRFLAALEATTTYELAGDRLTLRNGDGAIQVQASRPTVEPPP
jgi:heat shock protein HslJ